MMTLLEIFVLALALAMDAFSVAVGVGATRRDVSLGALLRLSFSFGLFQFFMPLLGWAGGATVSDLVGEYDHWVAFGLLVIVGGKMIHEGLRGEAHERLNDPTRGVTLLILSVATSIDALAVGMSLAFLKTPVFIPSVVIGVVAFTMTAAGVLLGERVGRLFGERVGVVGGGILIAIGLRILWTHLA